MKKSVRNAIAADIPAIVNIYNQGIEDRVATFETRPRTPEDIQKWFDGRHPIVVVERNGSVIGFATTHPYSTRKCYAGIAEFSVYVERDYCGQGIGKIAMIVLLSAAEEAGFWKLLSRVFPENEASLHLLRSLGFREVGIYKKHAQLDGVWRDVVIVEYLIRKRKGEKIKDKGSPNLILNWGDYVVMLKIISEFRVGVIPPDIKTVADSP